MNRENMAGEILKGHAGQYRTFSCPSGALTREEEEQCLSAALPGDRSRGNQTLRCVSCGGRLLLVSAYSAVQSGSAVGAVYQHAAFFENFQQWFEDGTAHELAFFRFAGEGDFRSVADQRTELRSGWNRAGAGLRESRCQLSLSPGRQAELACCCLSRGMTNDFGSLVILVPGSEDYAAYCRTVMEDVLRCVPTGLWRYLSFATNPDEAGKRHFAVLFAPEGTQVRPGERTAIRLEDETWPVSHTLRPETAELIRRGAEDPGLLRTVAVQVEREAELDQLTEERYVNFWRQHQLSGKPMDCSALRQYGEQLGQPLSERERRRLEEELRGRLSAPGSLERALGQDGTLMGVITPEELDQALSAYGSVFRALGRGMDQILSARLLDRILSSGQRTLEQLEEDGRRLDRCVSAGADGPLDRTAVERRREELDRETENANRLRKEAFERAIPAGWDWKRLGELLEGLRPCREEVGRSCRSRLARLAAEHLDEAKLPEGQAREFYARITGLLGGGPELAPLEAWYQAWQRQLEERRKVLEGMTSYRAYLALGRQDEACLDHLLGWFDSNGYQRAGVKDLLQAAELEWGEAWPRLLDRLDGLLRALGRRQRLGVWLGPEKGWADLYSELLACRIIGQKTGEGKICLWYHGAEAARPMKLSKVLETVEMLQPVVLEGKKDRGGWYNREALRVILASGMVRQEDRALLADVVELGDRDLLEQDGPHKGKKTSKRSFRVPAAVKIAALAAAALLAGVLLFSWFSRPQPAGTPGTEQSGAPSAQPGPDSSAVPSASQSGGRVTPRQPDAGQ